MIFSHQIVKLWDFSLLSGGSGGSVTRRVKRDRNPEEDNMRTCSFLLALVLASAPAAFAAEKAITPVGPYKVPDKHKTFIKDFHTLMKGNSDAARQFSLVDMGVAQPVARVIIWKCEDFGGALDPPECKPEILE